MSPTPVPSFKERAYLAIKERIITCQLRPGALVDQNLLMAEIGVSRTPVREALHSLEKEGLVVVMPRRGVVVAGLSVHEISNIYTVRETVEPLIVRLAAPQVEPDRLREFRRLFEEGGPDFLAVARGDFQMHLYLAEKTGNPYLIRLMENLLSQNLRIAILGAQLPDRMPGSRQEHFAILDRLLAGDGEGAAEAMRAHIVSAWDVATRVHRIRA